METISSYKEQGYSMQFLGQKTLFFHEGIPGFEGLKEFFLIQNAEEAPFLWLQATSNENIAFITVDPFSVLPDYAPDISDEDVALLEVQSEKDVFLISIVNIKDNAKMTANLLSPILINWKTRKGKQVVLKNHHLYSVKFPLT